MPSQLVPGRGRPADPDLENRVYTATLALFREVGWGGFSLDIVARRARVGKSALYTRWGSKETLIAAALANLVHTVPVLGTTGSLRSDLLQMATSILHFYIRGGGLILLRARIEAREYPEVFGQALLALERQGRQAGRTIVLQAIERGELPPKTSPAFILDTVAGTLINHIISTPLSKIAALEVNAADYAEHIVDFVLAGVGYRAVGPDRRTARSNMSARARRCMTILPRGGT
jgi:AcrR family transcriptional regulator